MYSRILVPLDGSPTADLALHHAAVLARLNGATIVLLHVIEEMKHSNGFERPRIYIEEVRPGFLAAGQKLLDEAALRLSVSSFRYHPAFLSIRILPESERLQHYRES